MTARARSPVSIPSPGLRTRGGFGSTGTRTRVFRSLERKCDEVAVLLDLGFEEAVSELRDAIEELRDSAPPLDDWVEEWVDQGARPAAARALAEAMAAFLARLGREGTSPRTLRAVTSDLQAAASLVFEYESPTRARVLESFTHPPWTREFERKFSDSPRLIARYGRNLERFARFLAEQS
jgi:hypothetical protein